MKKELYKCFEGELKLQTLHMSRVMIKPVYAICEQQRHRSACLDSITPLVVMFEIS